MTLDTKNAPEYVTNNDMQDGDLTHLGRLMNWLPLNHACTRLIYFGYMVGMTMEGIIMAACMNIQNFWQYNKEKFTKKNI
jgi:hypothetical protein